jgi:hypothetical protein
MLEATFRKFTMSFEPRTIDHLGLRLYSTLAPVVSELVSNAYDAESAKVEVTIPEGELTPSSEVIVKDYGHGMTADEVQDEFLPIGRNRRGPDSACVLSKNNKVKVTGRKGLGKLSGFGVANELQLRAIHEGVAVCLVLNYEDMRRWPETHLGSPYEPRLVLNLSGPTSEPNGTEIRLRQLHRKKPIDPESVRKGLAHRLRVIGPKFVVRVNGNEIQQGDRVRRSDCPAGFSWSTDELPEAGAIGSGLRVDGWIGFIESASQALRGVDIFANGKAVELGSYFNYGSTHVQFARAHLVGEINAQFLDAEADLAATARNSVVWESDYGQLLQNWGQTALRDVFDRWVELRRKRKHEVIVKVGGFDEWLKTRPPNEQRTAQRMLKLLVSDDALETSSAAKLIDVIKNSVETTAFHELVDAIEDEGGTATTLLRLFEEWRIIEAREHLKLADGRSEVLAKLQGFIDNGALEVQQIQPLFTENLWLLDSAWGDAEVQPTFTKLLREYAKDPKDIDEPDRRLDILGVRAGGPMTIVELKRPEKTLSYKDLTQIEHYVDWARSKLGTGPDAPPYVNGLLLVGKMNRAGEVSEKMKRLAGTDIRVQTFSDLHARANDHYADVDRRLRLIAPEYTKARRKSKKGK